jgi:hypothetical protein
MATDQSGIQSFIQNMAGTQTAAQANTPGATNNGNPNTVYNTPTWGTYVPTVTPVPGSTSPNVSFDYVTAPYTPSQPGYTSPFAADPTAAMVLSQMPQASGNDNVNRILSRLMNPGTYDPGTGTPGGPGPTPGPGPGPGVTPPTNTNGVAAPGGTGPISVGPISGPVQRRPWDLANNYNNAMPNTGAGVGASGALPWAQNGDLWGRAGTGSPAVQGAAGWLGSLMNKVGGEVKDSLGDTGSIWQLLDILSEPFVSGDWYDSRTGQWNNPLEAMGISDILQKTGLWNSNEQMVPMNQQQAEQMNARLNAQLQGLISGITEKSGAEAQERLNNLLSRSKLPEGWTNETMSPQEWQDYQRRFAFANLFTGRGTGSVNAITGLPSSSAMGDFMNSLTAEAMAKYKAMVERKGEQQR